MTLVCVVLVFPLIMLESRDFLVLDILRTTRQPLVEKFADNTSAVDVAFHPNGKLIASAAADCTIRLWGVPKQP